MIEVIQNRDYMLNTYKKEKNILINIMRFKVIQPNIYKFNEGDYVLFMDYRSGSRSSWAINLLNPREKVDKTQLIIYKLFKELLKR